MVGVFDYLIIRVIGLTVSMEETEDTSGEWEKIIILKINGNKYKKNNKKKNN